MNSGTGRQRTTTAGTDARRELILQAATSLFASQGYAQTTLDHIAKDMGVSKPFIYYYFRDKQELFEVISWQPVMDCFSALDFAANDPRPAATKAVEGLRGLIQATIQHHPASFFYYREPQVFRSEFIQAVKQHSHRFYDTLCPLLEQARWCLALSRDQDHRAGGLQPARLPLQLVPTRRPPHAQRGGG